MAGSHEKTVFYIAIGGERQDYSLLQDCAVAQWARITDALRHLWQSGEKDRTRVGNLYGCLEKLRASLVQTHRIRLFHDHLVHMGSTLVPGSTIGLSGSEACADLEGLLLQGRSALDRLSWEISARFKQQCQSFRGTRRIVERLASRDRLASALAKLLASSDEWFDGMFGQLESTGSWRDLIAHKRSLSEGVEACFSVICFEPHKVIVGDCETRLSGLSTSVFECAHQSAQWLSYLVLNALALMTEVQVLKFEDYALAWINAAVSISDFVLPAASGTPLGDHYLSVARMNPDGMTLKTNNVDPAIYKHGIVTPSIPGIYPA